MRASPFRFATVTCPLAVRGPSAPICASYFESIVNATAFTSKSDIVGMLPSLSDRSLARCSAAYLADVGSFSIPCIASLVMRNRPQLGQTNSQVLSRAVGTSSFASCPLTGHVLLLQFIWNLTTVNDDANRMRAERFHFVTTAAFIGRTNQDGIFDVRWSIARASSGRRAKRAFEKPCHPF